MKTLIAFLIFFCMMSTLSFATEKSKFIYENEIFNEDVTWRGVVVVHGYVVVAPQATLRIEPGTEIRFENSLLSKLPSLVIQGRLHAKGTAQHPILISSEISKKSQSSWGGIVFLATEKRNLIEQCKIENADIGIDVRYSAITLKSTSILNSRIALSSQDGVVQARGSTVSYSEIGIEIHNTEFEGVDMTVASCQKGLVVDKSSLMLTSSKIINNGQIGLEADECRIKITDAEFSGNTFGAILKNGEGQIVMSSFINNSNTALHIKSARMKIQRTLFANNRQDAIRMEDNNSLVLNNAFSSNGGYNIYNLGHKSISVIQNWWGGVEQNLIYEKIFDASDNKNSRAIQVFPWLSEKPKLMP